MTSRRSSSWLLALTAATALVLASYEPSAAKNNSEVGAAIVGGIAGIAIGAALSDNHRHKTKIYYNGYAPPYGAGGYNPYFNQAYSPAGNVVCYPAQRACYNNNGTLASHWTRRIYGR